MPLYDYRCESGHVTAESRLIAERDDEAICPECGEVSKRVFGGCANVFIPACFHTNWSDILPPNTTAKEFLKQGEYETKSRWV